MKDDIGVTGMTIHKWLGTSLAIVIVALLLWRWVVYKKDRWPSLIYLFSGILVVAALVYQGHLGGNQSFGSMDSSSSDTSHDSPSDQHASGASAPTSMPGMKMPGTD